MICACSMSETVQLEDGCTAAAAHVAQPPANNGAALHFGSNVSRLKSRFLQHVSDVAEPTSCRRRPLLEHQVSAPAASATGSTAAGPDVLDMSDHVEKFRHTRALFAQLAEQQSAPPARPWPLPRPVQRSFRSTSSASPPPSRNSHVDQVRRSASPSNDRSSRSFGQTLRHPQGQTVSCNGVTTWSQLGSRSSEENSRSLVGAGSSVVSSGSQLCSRLSEDDSGSKLYARSSVESARSEVTSRSLADGLRSASWRGGAVDPSEVAAVVLRRSNRTSLDLSVGAGRAVLLPKRRSREEKSLMVSKDCLEASLSQADEYWRRQHMEEFPVGDADPLMSESTFSSGSGEEMARSESGHDLAAALKDTTVSPTADSAEMWSRRLSAAMEAKCSIADSNRSSAAVECNGTNHTSLHAAENTGVMTSSGSFWAHHKLENTAGASLSDRETLCCATGGSHHVAVQSDSSTAVDLSRSSDSSRSFVYHEVAVSSSSPVSDLIKGNSADYSQHIAPQSNNSNLQTVVLRTCDPSRSSAVQVDLDHTAGASTVVLDTLKGNATNAGSDHMTSEMDSSRTLSTVNNLSQSLSARYDHERGSSTDCETLEGSVADCECKDVDTEKSVLPPYSTDCCKTAVLSASFITSSHAADNDSDEARLQQQTEDSVVTDTVLQQTDINDKSSSYNGSHSGAHLQENGDASRVSLEQRKQDTTCCLEITSNNSQETVVQELSALDESVKTADEMLPQKNRSVSTDLDAGADSPEVFNLSSDNGLQTGICLQRTENSDTILLGHQERTDSWGHGAACHPLQADTVWFRQQKRAGGCTSEAGIQIQDYNDVQAMSVSEDDESSGDTDYVVLGEPVSKQATRRSVEELKQARQSNTP